MISYKEELCDLSPEALSNPSPFLHVPSGHAEVALQRIVWG